jgi:7-carboxy-7-deazaguanine synthase
MSSTKSDAVSRSERLRITEIFYSIQGESRPAGLPTVFIRLTGCPLRCGYCDTEYAFHGGDQMTFEEITRQVKSYDTPLVCVTGGEPLAQRNCGRLLSLLSEQGYDVSLETSGALDIADIDQRVTIVMDIKTPGSGEAERNRWENLEYLKPGDQLKFVLCDRADYDWARQLVAERELAQKFSVLFSPTWGQLPERTLAEWILQDRLQVRFQLQLHKYLWGEQPGH